MKQLTVCIDDGLQGEVVYRAEISHTEEDYQELKSDLEFVREENRKLKDSNTILKKGGQVVFTLEKRIDELLEENKKLKEDYKVLGILNDEIRRVNENLREENKKLKEELEYYKNKSSRQEAVIKIAAME